MNAARGRSLGFAAATVAILLLAYGPLLAEFFANLWERPHYQYFPFVFGAFGWLTWQRCRAARGKESNGSVEHRSSGVAPKIDSSLTPLLRRSSLAACVYHYGPVAALVAAWAVLGLAYLVNSPWLAYLSAVCLAAAAFLRVSAQWHVTYLWGVWLLLWLVLPLPMGRDQQLISLLQRSSSQLSSFVLDWVGAIHLMEGNTLLVGDKEFFVDEACSGIVSVLSIVACAVIYGVWRNRPPVHLLLLTAAGVGWATLMNVLRISVIAMAYAWFGIDWSKGTPHELLGLAIFLLTFLALVSTDYLLLGLLAPIKSDDGQWYGEPPRFGARIADAWDWLQGWGRPVLAEVRDEWREGESSAENHESRARIGATAWQFSWSDRKAQTEDADLPSGPLPKGEGGGIALARRFVLGVVPLVAFAALASAQLVLSHGPAPGRWGQPHNLERALAVNETALPRQCCTLDRISYAPVEREFDNLFGNFSRTYEYRDARGNTYLVSCDFPLEAGGHELTVCYRGIGWEMTRREVRDVATSATDANATWGYAEAEFSKPDGSHAFLVFCAFDEYGMPVTPPTYSLWQDLWRTIQRQSLGKRRERTYQVQIWVSSGTAIDEEQQQTARELLIDVRERFWKLIAGEE